MGNSFLDELEWRGMLHQSTPDVDEHLSESPRVGYIGFDPTSDSMHIGNLVQIMILIHFQRYGHKPIALIGGATGMIGDPSGKSSERKLLDQKKLEKNSLALKKQFLKFLDFSKDRLNSAEMINNFDWMKEFSLIDFSREVGKHITVNYMMSKESVKKRISDESSEGMSFTEFTYQLIQGYDFLELFRNKKCTIQIGGSDQWGNITAGIDLIHRKHNKKSYGLTLPLITNADGTKFGKTESGAVWLDVARTSIYQFYQFWVRVDDRDVIRYLKYFTFLPQDGIEQLAKQHEAEPQARIAHKALAQEVTKLVHGETATAEAIRASEILFGGGLDGITEATFREIACEVPTCEFATDRFSGEGIWVPEILHEAGLAQSRGQARKDVKSGGVYVNSKRVDNEQQKLNSEDLIFNKYVLLRRGKKNYALVIVL